MNQIIIKSFKIRHHKHQKETFLLDLLGIHLRYIVIVLTVMFDGYIMFLLFHTMLVTLCFVKEINHLGMFLRMR